MKAKEEIEKIKKQMGNVQVAGHTVWNTQQIADVIEKADKQNAILKIEITHGFEVGKRCYNMIIWHFPKLESA